MIVGSATIKVTINDGRRRIFVLLIRIALIGEIVEAPHSATRWGSPSARNRQANILNIDCRKTAATKIDARESTQKKSRHHARSQTIATPDAKLASISSSYYSPHAKNRREQKDILDLPLSAATAEPA
jgi:hypothetical protein